MASVRARFDPALSEAIRDALARSDRRAIDMLDDIGQRGAELARSLASNRTGTFVDTIDHEVDEALMAVSVGSKSRIAHIIESGRDPGAMPPPAAIAEAFGLTPSEGFVVARSIGEWGTPGDGTFEFVRKNMDLDVERAAGDFARAVALEGY